MKKILLLLLLPTIGIIIYGCEKKIEADPSGDSEVVSVCFTYNLPVDGGASMTKASNAEVFDSFYQRIQSGDLIAENYSLELTNVDTGETVSYSGRWQDRKLFTLRTGTYRISGISTAYGDTIQERCSFSFNEIFVVTASTHEIALTAVYDCFLIVFSGNDISTIVNNNGEYEASLFTFEQYKYAFVNDKLYKENRRSDAYIGGFLSNGDAFKCFTGDLTFEKGKYYVYAIVNGGLMFPGMEDGSINSENATVVSLNNAGELGQMIPESERDKVKRLVISGDINGTDFLFIRNLTNLVSLDISSANIVRGGEAFIKYEETAEGVTYPDETYGIGMWAIEDHYTKKETLEFNFWGMKNIEEIVLPKSLKYISNCCFYGCHKLKNITIPKGTSMGDGYLEADSFWSCLSLENIFVEAGNTSLFSQDGCLYTMADGNKILLAVPAGKKYFTMPEDVDTAYPYSFPQGCQLQELTLGAHSPVLDPYYFGNFLELRRFNVAANNNLYSEIDGVLYDKDQKTIVCYPCQRREESYTIKSGITTVGASCFNTCVFLKEMVVPEGVTVIGESAFFDCRRLQKLVLPSSLTTIKASAIQHDSDLKTIISYAVTPPVISDEFVFFDVQPNQILVPASSVSQYQQAPYWCNYASIITSIE